MVVKLSKPCVVGRLPATVIVTFHKGEKGACALQPWLCHCPSPHNHPLFPSYKTASLCLSATLHSPQLRSFEDTPN